MPWSSSPPATTTDPIDGPTTESRFSSPHTTHGSAASTDPARAECETGCTPRRSHRLSRTSPSTPPVYVRRSHAHRRECCVLPGHRSAVLHPTTPAAPIPMGNGSDEIPLRQRIADLQDYRRLDAADYPSVRVPGVEMPCHLTHEQALQRSRMVSRSPSPSTTATPTTLPSRSISPDPALHYRRREPTFISSRGISCRPGKSLLRHRIRDRWHGSQE